jgi:murein L,D-transpeptidase YcbB/YkuD
VTPATPVAVKYSEPVPWPQVVPGGLPAFPGSAWTPDIPVGPGVAARASQLLSQLWRSGEGTFKTEQTSGRWITYRATKMGTLKGVVAYRLVSPDSTANLTNSRPTATAATPISYSAPSSPSSPSSRLSLPTLRRGSKGPSVVTLQQRLGIDADGAFGPATERAVKAFQSSHGLSVDGVVGRDTWTALYT